MTTFNRKMKPITAAIGTAFVASLAAASFAHAENPFAAKQLDTGYDQLAQADAEGKCGEGKCGESKDDTEGKCGESKGDAEGKCGESKGDAEGKGPAEGKCGEGKCGEGKCGDSKDDAEGKCGGAA